MKNAFNGLIWRPDSVEIRISDPECRSVEITQNPKINRKREWINREQSFKDFLNNTNSLMYV